MEKRLGSVYLDFQDALLSAFPSDEDLERMVRYQLNQNLVAIVKPGNLKAKIFDLIKWAEANGALISLIDGARKENVGNIALQEFEERYKKNHIVEMLSATENTFGNQAVKIIDPQYPGKTCVGVDRSYQRQLFIDVLENLRLKLSDTKNLLEWIGTPGIGKSSLISLLINECQLRNSPFILIDFNQQTNLLKLFVSEPVYLLEYMVSLLKIDGATSDLLDRKVEEYRSHLPVEGGVHGYKRLGPRPRNFREPEWIFRLLEASAELDRLVSRYVENYPGNQYPLVVFFDGCEKIEEPLASWIEEFVIEPLIRGNQCLFVWMSRRPRKWGNRVAYYKQSNELGSFNELDMRTQLREQLGVLGSPVNVADKIYQRVFAYTGGHPYANWVVVQQLVNWGNINSVQSESSEMALIALAEREAEIHQNIFEYIIASHAFKGLSHIQRLAMELCSIIRLIDRPILQRVLQECSSDNEINHWVTKDFGKLFSELEATHLLTWQNNRFIVEENLRQIIKENLFWQAKATFIKVNQVALNVYQERLKRNINNREVLIVEELYQIASLNRTGVNNIDLFATLQTRLEELLNYEPYLDDLETSLDRLQKAIENDKEIDKILALDNMNRISLIDLSKRIQVFKDNKLKE